MTRESAAVAMLSRLKWLTSANAIRCGTPRHTGCHATGGGAAVAFVGVGVGVGMRDTACTPPFTAEDVRAPPPGRGPAYDPRRPCRPGQRGGILGRRLRH